MNFYIWSYSEDESDTEEYIEFSIKCCIFVEAAYTYGDYVYLKNMTDTTNENYDHFI